MGRRHQEGRARGALVRKGDLIIQFECQDLQDAIDHQEVLVDDADDAYTAAVENLEITKKEADNNVRKSQEKLDDAKEALARYIECDGPIAIANAQGDVRVAQHDVVLAQAKLDFKLKVNKDPELNLPYSQNEIKADEIGIGHLKLVLDKAQSQLDMLRKFEDKKQKRTLQSAIDDATLDLEHDKIQGKTQVITAKSAERSKKAQFAKQTEVLNELLVKKAKLTVKALNEGLVVYLVGSKSHRADNDISIEVGEKIDPNKLLMIVPDMTTLQVRTKVYEAMIEQVRVGLDAFVHLDSREDVTLSGKIADVSVLPDSSQWWQPDVKVFSVAVQPRQEDRRPQAGHDRAGRDGAGPVARRHAQRAHRGPLQRAGRALLLAGQERRRREDPGQDRPHERHPRASSRWSGRGRPGPPFPADGQAVPPEARTPREGDLAMTLGDCPSGTTGRKALISCLPSRRKI